MYKLNLAVCCLVGLAEGSSALALASPNELARIVCLSYASGRISHGDWLQRETAKAWLTSGDITYGGTMRCWLENKKDKKDTDQ